MRKIKIKINRDSRKNRKIAYRDPLSRGE